MKIDPAVIRRMVLDQQKLQREIDAITESKLGADLTQVRGMLITARHHSRLLEANLNLVLCHLL